MKKLMLLFVAFAFVGFLSANNVTDDPPAKKTQTTQVEQKDTKSTNCQTECQKAKTVCCSKEKKTTTTQEEQKKDKK